MTEDLATWLLEQIAADERLARLATAAPWLAQVRDVEPGAGRRYSAVGRVAVDVPGRQRWLYAGSDNGHDARHIANFDPARVLAECATKRWIIAEHVVFQPPPEVAPPSTVTECPTCGMELCPTLRFLLLPYADRPGYRTEWAP